jgi:hydrogenase maturation protein HypF
LEAGVGELLTSAELPIVLLPKRAACDVQLPGVAPDLPALGIMLPYTPLHYLLFHQAAGRPSGSQWLNKSQDLLLVMTSANPGGEPLVIDNTEARQRLAGIADAFLIHDRDICVRCDDTVMRWQGTAPAFVRRARGFTPQAIRLPADGPSVLATGGWFKNTVCLTRGDQAFVSQHIGDLDNPATCAAVEEIAEHMMAVLEVEPEIVAHDRHPDFFSSRFATAFADERGLRRIPVQHHHAHAAAVCAEHGVDEPVLALVLDGVGLGSDDTPWGGELLRVNAGDFQRLGHLSPLALPGGDRAAREPWRIAAGVLFDLGAADEIEKHFPLPGASTVRQMLERGVNTPRASSAGRLFDPDAGLLGLRQVSSFEAQAAMELEGAAAAYGPVPPMDAGFEITPSGILDCQALMAALPAIADPGKGAALFHATFAAGLGEWVRITAEKQQLRTVILAGGCLLNAILANALSAQISAAGIRVLQAQRVPPSDGGLSLGQAWVALNRLKTKEKNGCA